MTGSTVPRIGVSGCLLGQAVRYDGGHKRDDWIAETLARRFELVPFCPEMAIGLGTPRPPMQLVQRGGETRVAAVADRTRDFTARFEGVLDRVVGATTLSGYILKSGSPSCGKERVPVHDGGGTELHRTGTGLFAAPLQARFPALPVEEETRLADPRQRENFVERVLTMHRWQQLARTGFSAQALVDFHTRHKFFIQAHDETIYRELGRLVAVAGDGDVGTVCDTYVVRMMQGLRRLATPAKHANVLMHLMGFLKKQLSAQDKEELLALIEAQRVGRVPVSVPIESIRQHLRTHPNDYLDKQVYLATDEVDSIARAPD